MLYYKYCKHDWACSATFITGKYMKLKHYALYLFVFLLLIISCASFFADDYVSRSSNTTFSSMNLYYAFMGRFDEIGIISDSQEDVKTTYVLGDEADVVRRYKEILYFLNYLNDAPEDGVFDDAMQNAVKLYQKDKGFTQSGELDSATMNALSGEEIIYVQGKSGEEIRNYQRILYFLDYSDESPSGTFTKATRTAVLAYQKKNYLEETGEIDTATQIALNNETVVYMKGKTSEEIIPYQELLIEQGYLKSNADGVFGSTTESAVKAYQKAKGLTQTGIIDEATKEKMDAEIEAQTPTDE